MTTILIRVPAPLHTHAQNTRVQVNGPSQQEASPTNAAGRVGSLAPLSAPRALKLLCLLLASPKASGLLWQTLLRACCPHTPERRIHGSHLSPAQPANGAPLQVWVLLIPRDAVLLSDRCGRWGLVFRRVTCTL